MLLLLPSIPLFMPPTPSMLDLVRLSPRRLFPPGGIELFRQVAVLTDLSEGDEVLGVACGKGVSLEYFAREFGVTASGVEFDPWMVEGWQERGIEIPVYGFQGRGWLRLSVQGYNTEDDLAALVRAVAAFKG